MKIKKLAYMSMLFMFFFSGTSQAAHPAVIKDAWIADAPPIAKIRAAYMKLENNGDHMISILSFSSPDFERIELHRTISAGGMIRMEEVKELSLKAGQQIEFKPGGYHLMLFYPKRKLKTGDKVNFQLKLKNKMTTRFSAVVRKRGNDKGMMMDHKHHKCGGGKCGGK